MLAVSPACRTVPSCGPAPFFATRLKMPLRVVTGTSQPAKAHQIALSHPVAKISTVRKVFGREDNDKPSDRR